MTFWNVVAIALIVSALYSLWERVVFDIFDAIRDWIKEHKRR